MIAVKSSRGKNGQRAGSNKDKKQSDGNAVDGDDNKKKGPKTYTRRKINPASPPTAIDIHGMRVHFPFKPYPCQVLYMTKVMDALLRGENALLESPTGTGKTLCLLCACLAWQREQARTIHQKGFDAAFSQTSSSIGGGSNGGGQQQDSTKKGQANRVPTIIYASRTHSQLSQVVRELRSTRYRPTHAILGSREQMCVNPKVKKEQSSVSDINHDCNKLGKERKCRFKNRLEGFSPRSNEEGVGPEIQPVMDMEDLITMGKESSVCPFYYTRGQVENAELVLLPYNYLFDKDARTTTLAEIPWNNAIVIFDEAHNLESFASESASFDLSNTDIAGCISEVQKAINYLQAMSDDGGYGVKMDNLLRLKAIFIKFEDYILNQLDSRAAYSGEFMMEVFQQGAMINFSNHEIFIEEVRKVNDLLMDLRGTGATRGSPRLEHFVQCIKRVFHHNTESRCLAKAAFYRVHVSPKPPPGAKTGNQPAGRTVSYWCFAPALAMEELAGLNVRSILVTSGTLSPLPSYSLELGLHFPHTLENEHVIADSQIHVRVIGKGCSGKLLNSSYDRRKDGDYYSELGNTLVQLAEVVPGGMLIFYPSYAVMEACLERWGGPTSNRPQFNKGKKDFFAKRAPVNNNKYSFPFAPLSYFEDQNNGRVQPWKALLGKKAIVVEPKSTSDLNDAINEFKRYLSQPKSRGCILMGVCRGKISEGLSFAHEQSRAVIITGLPFPPSHDPKVKMKQEYLNRMRTSANIKVSGEGGFGPSSSVSYKLSGTDWYVQQAHRAVNQAIGRVIRNKDDYGAVLLLDSRFDQPQNRNGMSKWLRPHIQKDEGMEVAKSELKRFYEQAEATYQIIVKESAKTVVLQYEDDEPLLGPSKTITKVAVVRSDESAQRSSEVNEANTYFGPDQVIARLDLDEMQRRQPEVSKVHPVEPVVSNSGPTNNDELFDPQRTSMVKSKSSTGAAAKSSNVASAFFEKAKQLLSSEELSSIKKAIVAMKNHADNRDIRSYTSSAGEIVNLVIAHEGLEEAIKRESDAALFLFFRLLPRQYRGNVEVVALNAAFEKSNLGNLCKENLSSGNFAIIQSDMVSLLQRLWCCEGEDVMTTSAYVDKAQAVLQTILNTDRSSASAMLRAYLKLVPSRLLNSTQCLGNEIIASLAIEKMKKADKANKGEAAINTDRFKLSSWQARANGSSIGADHSNLSGVESQQSTPLLAGLSGGVNPYAKRSSYNVLNPYAKKPVNSGGLSQGVNPYAKKVPSLAVSLSQQQNDAPVKRKHDSAVVANPYAKRKPAMASAFAAPSTLNKAVHPSQSTSQLNSTKMNLLKTGSVPVTKITNSSTHDENKSSITSFIETIESDPYTKHKTSNIAKNIKANAPTNLVCPLCSKRCKVPCLAECGHMACLQCWKDWLHRSQTCPTCRKPATNDTIARMVFEQKAGTGAPTLSQIICNANEDDVKAGDKDDSDGELELC